MIDTPATPDRAAFLRTLQQHGHLGQLAAIIRAVQHAPDPVARSPEVQLLLARSLADQGRFRQAAGVYDHVLAIGVDDEVVAWELRLWRAFLSIYQASDVAPMMDAGQAARA